MDKNAEIEQYFAFWEKPFPIVAEHGHWVRWGSLLRVWLPSIDGVPINLEVVGEIPRGLKKYAPLDLELRFLFLKGNFYKDEIYSSAARRAAVLLRRVISSPS